MSSNINNDGSNTDGNNEVSKYRKQNEPSVFVGLFGFLMMIIGSFSIYYLDSGLNNIIIYNGVLSVLIIVGIGLCFNYYMTVWSVYSYFIDE